jgi:hypothetical protein
MTLLSPASPAVAVIILLRTAEGSTPIRESCRLGKTEDQNPRQAPPA